MRKRFLLPLLVLLLTTLSTHAYVFQSGDLYYNITSDTTVEVTYQKYVNSTNYQGLTTATIPETVTYNGTTYSVTSIGNYAFSDCSSLTSITIPNSVTSIGNYAFSECSALTSITIPNSVTSIGGSAFLSCSSLTSITIPESVTSIGKSAFAWCSSLTSITIPNSVTSIGYEAFSGCSALPVVDNLRYADTYLVAAVKSLSTYIIKEGTKWIGSSAFDGCSSLTSITIPNSVTSIGYEAFSDCSSLTSITIPNSVTSIGSSAFSGCSALTSIVVESGNTIYDSRDNCNAIIETASNTLIAGCQSTIIPNSVTSIGEEAFKYCESLTSITIPNSVTSIGSSAFYGCSSLTSITIPESVTSIGSYAFSGCSSLTSITIPESVTSIGASAFAWCSSLTTVTSMSCTPPDCGSSVFSYTPSEKTLVVPNSSLEAYKSSSPWNKFTTFESIEYPTLSVQSANALMGTAHIDQEVDCDSIAIISAVGNLGYAFTQWTDGNTDNPRTVLITQDTLFTAEFGLAYSGKCGDDLYWEYSDKALSITGNGKMYDFSTSTIPWLLLCDSIQNITIGDDVRSIGSCAFQGCSSLTSITIPNKVLVNVDILNPNAVYFVNTEGWSNIHVYAWGGTKDGTTWPGEIATKADFTYQGYDIYYFTATPGDYEYCIFNNGYWGTSNQTEDLVWTGGQAYFNDEWHTIQGDLSYKVAIGANAFRGCSSLTSITIPNSVTSIGDCAFYDCSSLPVVDNVRYADTYLVEAVDKSLSTYTIKAGTKWIGDYAFYNCSSLTSITIPNSVTSIGNDAFYECYKLTSITIPNSVTSIGNDAFYKCTSLTTVTSMSCTPPDCGSSVFYNTPSEKTLVVPNISLNAYGKTYPWNEFSTIEKMFALSVQSSDTQMGQTQIDQDVDCDSVAIIAATSNYGYHFTQWTDGNTDNPRTILLTQDTIFTAEFAMDYSGKCGDDLYWAYRNKEVRITGTGAMYNYTDGTMPWTLLRDSIMTVRIGNNATSIGEYAFANTPKLAKLYIGANVEDIGANAFAGCRRLYDIYCYPIEPPLAETNSFANYNVYVYVPCENQRDYTLDVVWGEFKFIECIGSEVVVLPDDTVTVSPNYEDATFTWPVTDGADTYALVITKDNITFCTLVFNAQGQLVSIAFKPRRQNAPAEEGTTPATYAEMTANGFRFTVTGLDEGAAYAYTFTVRNAANSVLETYTGEFTTLSNTPTAISDSPDATETVSDKGAEKILRDGQVLIIRNGETYDMMGQRL